MLIILGLPKFYSWPKSHCSDPNPKVEQIYRNVNEDKILRVQNFSVLNRHLRSYYQVRLSRLESGNKGGSYKVSLTNVMTNETERQHCSSDIHRL